MDAGQEVMYGLLFDSDDNSDEENFRVRRPRTFWERPNYFELYDDVFFRTRFRLSKDSTLIVLQHIKDRLEYASGDR